MAERLFVFPKDLVTLQVVTHINVAYKKYNLIKDTYAKQPHQRVTVNEMASWLGVDVIELQKRLK